MFFDKLEKSNEHFTIKDYAFLISSLVMITVIMFPVALKEAFMRGYGTGYMIGAFIMYMVFLPLYWFVCTNVLCVLTDALISLINRFRHRKDKLK